MDRPQPQQQPPPASFQTQQDYIRKKKAFEEAFRDFHKEVFMSKILNANKSAGVKNTETHLVDKLVNSAVSLDMANVGEGLLALITVVLRELLTVRDRSNEIEYELFKAIRDVKKIKSELGIPDDKKK